MRYLALVKLACLCMLALGESRNHKSEPLIFITNLGTIIYVEDLHHPNSAKEIILSDAKNNEDQDLESMLAIPTKIAAINASDDPDQENIYLLTYKSNNIDLWKLKPSRNPQKLLAEHMGVLEKNIKNVTKIEISADDQAVLTIVWSDGKNSYVHQWFMKNSSGQQRNLESAIIPHCTAITGNRNGITAMNKAYSKRNSCLFSMDFRKERAEQIFRYVENPKFAGYTCADLFNGDRHSKMFHPVDIHNNPTTKENFILTDTCKVYKKDQFTGKFTALKEHEGSDQHSFVGCKKLIVYDSRLVLVDSSDELKVYKRRKGMTDYEPETLELESNFIYLEFSRANDKLLEDKIVDACKVFSNK